MPCASEHLEPHEDEKQRRRRANLFIYVENTRARLTGTTADIPDSIYKQAKHIYGEGNPCDITEQLCTLMKSLPDDLREQIVYNARDAHARDLANWWEDHLRIDVQREAREQQAVTDKQIRETAKAKLTPHEKKLFGIED